MKRMSDVFELLLKVEENQGEPFLADALDFLLSLPRGTSGRIIIERSEESAALEALNAYRGEI